MKICFLVFILTNLLEYNSLETLETEKNTFFCFVF